MSRIFGNAGHSVLRGGFGINGDYFGQALATFFDLRNTLGLRIVVHYRSEYLRCGMFALSGSGLDYYGPAGACSAGGEPRPTVHQHPQPIRGVLPAPPVVQSIFPQQQPADNSLRIESSLDQNLTTPKSYSWSATFERQLPKNTMIQISYLGRVGRHLLAQRDIMQPIDLVDPKSKMDWYTAGTMLAKQRAQGVATSRIATIPYFENLFPGAAGNLGYNTSLTSTQAIYQLINDVGGDYTTTQAIIDSISIVGPNAFYQPQYGALSAWGSIGNSNYHALAASYKIRTSSLTADFNYTWSHSLDDSSGLQTGGRVQRRVFHS